MTQAAPGYDTPIPRRTATPGTQAPNGLPPIPGPSTGGVDPRGQTQAPSTGQQLVAAELMKASDIADMAAALGVYADQYPATKPMVASLIQRFAAYQALNPPTDEELAKNYPGATPADYATIRARWRENNKDVVQQMETAYNQGLSLMKSYGAVGASPRSPAQEQQSAATAQHTNLQNAELERQAAQREKVRGDDSKGNPITGYLDSEWAAAESKAADQALARARFEYEKKYATDPTSLPYITQAYKEKHDEVLRLEREKIRLEGIEKEHRDRLLDFWKTEELGGRAQYQEESANARQQASNEVSQRGQDISATNNQANLLGDLFEKSLPYRISPGQLNSWNQTMGRMGVAPIPATPFMDVAGQSYNAAANYAPNAYGGGYAPPPVGAITAPTYQMPPPPAGIFPSAGPPPLDPSVFGLGMTPPGFDPFDPEEE